MTPALLTPPVRTDHALTDDDSAVSHWRSHYGPRSAVASLPPGAGLRHVVADAGALALCELDAPAGFGYRFDSLGPLVVASVRSGRFEFSTQGSHRRVQSGDVLLTAEPDAPRSGLSEGAVVQLALLDQDLVAQVASSGADAAAPVRFTGLDPVSPAAAAHWKATRMFTAGVLADPAAAANPLVLGSVARLLAATTLATFPNTASGGPTRRDNRDAAADSLRRAVAYIDDHPRDDLSVADVAAAARVSVRAVQLAFRRHLGTTPMGYLRAVRLRHVHDELLRADPAATTVSAVALRWGFAHHGRFTTLYRRTYGVLPHETLRRGGPRG